MANYSFSHSDASIVCLNLLENRIWLMFLWPKLKINSPLPNQKQGTFFQLFNIFSYFQQNMSGYITGNIFS